MSPHECNEDVGGSRKIHSWHVHLDSALPNMYAIILNFISKRFLIAAWHASSLVDSQPDVYHIAELVELKLKRSRCSQLFNQVNVIKPNFIASRLERFVAMIIFA